jgi:hypothetical protein
LLVVGAAALAGLEVGLKDNCLRMFKRAKFINPHLDVDEHGHVGGEGKVSAVVHPLPPTPVPSLDLTPTGVEVGKVLEVLVAQAVAISSPPAKMCF